MPNAIAVERPALAERSHMEGCPGIEGDGRIEEFVSRRPAQPDKAVPARDVIVTRCIECGGSSLKEVDH